MTITRSGEATVGPILYGSARSPFVRKVRIVLKVKAIDYTWDTDYYAFLKDVNPLEKVPAWVRQDGEVLFDSRVICEYLEVAEPNPATLPGNALDRLEIKRWEALADGICDAAVSIVVEEARSVVAERSAAWITKQRGKIERGIEVVAQRLGTRRWCSQDQLTLADAALGSALGYLDLRLPSFSWRARHVALSNYANQLAALESFAATEAPAISPSS